MTLRELYADKAARTQPTLVLFSQVYVPDPAAVGQYMHQAAAAMVARGYRVIAFAADSGYEDPSQRFARYERLDGVHVVRLPFSSFGKNSIRNRLLGGSIFTTEAALLAAALPRVDHVLVSTNPPMIGAAGIALALSRRSRLSLWMMDINPDQIVATGRMAANSLPVVGFDWLNEHTFLRAQNVITLDPFMAERLQAKSAACPTPEVIPPWPILSVGELDRRAGQRFRAAHGLTDKRVVMFSGNLSPLHPVDTLLEAARTLQDDPRLEFVFVGGGSARERIAAYGLRNLRFLPYQPLSELEESLSAADVHLVSMGDAMVGIVHPSKIYSAMAVGRPILALGPQRSHIASLVREHQIGWHVEHGAVDAA
ncbi:MAG TPA: glycosyltransferase family 4 protein, partial [Polyangiales bacterium]|nr:glycosyltransferase family 4 protein [Polyangiales bacterium]